MRPAWRGASAVLRLLGWLTPSLLLLLQVLWCPHAARGDCGTPPDVPNATADLENVTSLTTFPAGHELSYYCNDGFVKVIGMLDIVKCLQNGKWSELEVFCKRSCGSAPRVRYGHMQDIYIPVRYHPAGFILEYECNPGFARNHSISANITCLQNYTWSKPEVFCYKRSCPDPGKIANGHITIPTDTLFASYIYFSCNPGYKLVGKNSTYCFYQGDDMNWEDPFPECQEIPTTTQKPTTMDAQVTKVPSAPPKPTTVNIPGTESPSAPQKHTAINVPATKSPSTPQKHTTINIPATKSPSTPQKHTTVNIPATKSPSAPQKPTTVNVPATEALSAPQKPTTVNVPATKSPSTPQKHTTVNIPATKSPSTPQKPTTVNVPATKSPSTPQKPTTVNVPATKSPSTPQKPTTVNVPATEALSAPQKPTTVNVPATEATPTLQNLTTRNSSTTKALLIPQKFALTVLAMDAPPTSQKPITAKDSATIAKTSSVSKALSTKTQLTVQTLLMTNSSATRATPKPQSFTTAKASYAQSLPVTQKFSTVHAPVTTGLHTTQTSAHMAATKNQPHSTSKGSGLLATGLTITVSGLTVGAIIIAIIIVNKIFWDWRRSGTHIYDIDSFAYDAGSHWLPDLAKEEIRRKRIQVHRIS